MIKRRARETALQKHSPETRTRTYYTVRRVWFVFICLAARLQAHNCPVLSANAANRSEVSHSQTRITPSAATAEGSNKFFRKLKTGNLI